MTCPTCRGPYESVRASVRARPLSYACCPSSCTGTELLFPAAVPPSFVALLLFFAFRPSLFVLRPSSFALRPSPFVFCCSSFVFCPSLLVLRLSSCVFRLSSFVFCFSSIVLRLSFLRPTVDCHRPFVFSRAVDPLPLCPATA